MKLKQIKLWKNISQVVYASSKIELLIATLTVNKDVQSPDSSRTSVFG